MASISTLGNGLRGITFVDGVKHKSIRLGKMSDKDARKVLGHIDELIGGKRSGLAFDPKTRDWLDTIDDVLHERLRAVGLVNARESTDGRTLAGMIDKYISRRTDVKPGTVKVWKQARRHLTAFFGEARKIETITPADADDYRRKLRADYSEAYTAKMMISAKAIFRDAVRRRWLDESPFLEVKVGSQRNAARQAFIDHATIDKIIAAVPDLEWKLIITLARYGGLRVPSEPLGLRWSDVLWEQKRLIVHSPKTERHEGMSQRIIPLFPELEALLLKAFENAEPGAEYVITSWRTSAVNLRTQFEKIIARAGVKPWPKLWQNLRSSRQTELENQFPTHVVCGWLRNGPAIFRRHYLQTTDEHFAKALANGVNQQPKQPAWNPAQSLPEIPGNGMESAQPQNRNIPDLPGISVGCIILQKEGMGAIGFEPMKA